TYPAADIKAGTRREENDSRIVVWHHDEGGICGHDRDVRAASPNDDLAVASQIPVVTRLAPLALHRVHYILLLREERVAEIGGPTHVRRHHFQHRRKRQKRLN